MPKPPKAVLFDLDGTLLDTAADLVGALNHVLQVHGEPEQPFEVVRNYVSRGAIALLCKGFGIESTDSRIKPLWDEMLDYYAENLCHHTRFFEGMENVLHTIENAGKPWGIVTNKPGFLTDPLLEQLDITPRVGCVVSGDTLPTRKPDPAPMLYAAKQIGVASSECIYIGDDLRDVQAGQGAAMKTIAAAYGYIIPGDDPASWGADGIIYTPTEINDWLT